MFDYMHSLSLSGPSYRTLPYRTRAVPVPGVFHGPFKPDAEPLELRRGEGAHNSAGHGLHLQEQLAFVRATTGHRVVGRGTARTASTVSVVVVVSCR